MLGPLRFLYVGAGDASAAAKAYAAAGARVLWDIDAFGTTVAAVDAGLGVPLLLAGHRPPSSVLPVVAVDGLAAVVARLEKAGWKAEGDAFEIPNGPCRLVVDPAGAEWALFEDVRPDAMEQMARSSTR